MTLAELLEAVTPGPWECVTYADEDWVARPPGPVKFSPADEWLIVSDVANGSLRRADGSLIALAPDLARLALDMGEALRTIRDDTACDDPECPCSAGKIAALLARLDGVAAGKEEA